MSLGWVLLTGKWNTAILTIPAGAEAESAFSHFISGELGCSCCSSASALYVEPAVPTVP